MAAGGISHRYFCPNNAMLKTTLAATYSGMNATEDAHAADHTVTPFTYQKNNTTNLILTSSYNRKFSARHTNQTGFTYTRLFYNMRLNLAPFEMCIRDRYPEYPDIPISFFHQISEYP